MAVGSIALIVLSIVGMGAAWGMSRILDKLAGRRFSQAPLTQMLKDPVATSIYYGARWIGVCMLIGMLFSRVV